MDPSVGSMLKTLQRKNLNSLDSSSSSYISEVLGSMQQLLQVTNTSNVGDGDVELFGIARNLLTVESNISSACNNNITQGEKITSCTSPPESDTARSLPSSRFLANWELVALGILTLKSIIRKLVMSKDGTNIREAVISIALNEVPILLDHKEPRVRGHCASFIRTLSEYCCCCLSMDGDTDTTTGMDLFMSMLKHLLQRTQTYFKRVDTTRPAALGNVSSIPLDDTTGWQALESYINALHELLGGCVSNSNMRRQIIALFRCYKYEDDCDIEDGFEGGKYGYESDEDLARLALYVLLSGASKHINRYVRESSHKFIRLLLEIYSNEISSTSSPPPPMCAASTTTFSSSFSSSISSSSSSSSVISSVIPQIHTPFDVMQLVADALNLGLADNWSQIRHAAILSTRSFLTYHSTDEARRPFISKLLPRLCLNRFYAAEGVKAASHETWRAVMGMRGREMYAQCVADAVEYYVDASKANNHMISEAACHSMAEMSAKVDRSAVQPYVPQMLEALCACLTDDSWPVRDAASISVGMVVRWFPTLIGPEKLQDIFAQWETNLQDSVWSVRENAALAWGEVMASEKRELCELSSERVISLLQENLMRALKEPSDEMRKEVSFIKPQMLQMMLEKGAALKEMRASNVSDPPSRGNASIDVDMKNLQIKVTSKKFSWRRGGGWGCCLDCMVTSKGGHWEASDGSVYLLRELAGFHAQKASEFLGNLWTLLDQNHFKECDKLHTTILEQLPEIFQRLGGPQVINMHLDKFGTSPIYNALLSKTPLKTTAAEVCTRQLANSIGIPVFLQRVKDGKERDVFVQILCHVQYTNEI